MLKDYLLFSFGNLRSRRLRSWLTMLGIFIGVAAVVSLISLGEGLRVAITSQFGFLGSDVLSIQASGLNYAGPPGTGVVNPLSDTLADEIKKINGVEAAFNRKIETATVEFNNKQVIGFAGSTPEGENRKIFEKMVNLKTAQGRLLKEGDNKRVILGNSFKESDMFGKGLKAGDSILINNAKFQVIGILEKKGSFIFDNVVLMNEKAMLDFFGDEHTANVIAVKVKDVNSIDSIKEDIEKLLRKERGVKKGEEDFVVQSPQKILESLNSTLFAVQLFIYIIATISLLVGGIGIMNTMYTAVLERTKEIGIMKAIGAKNSGVFTLFFMESGFLGMVGGLIGIVIGLILAYGLAFIGKLALGSDLIQAKASLLLIFGALAFSFFIGTIFGVLPAFQASKLHPVDSIRGSQ